MSSHKRELVRKAINSNYKNYGEKGLDSHGNLLAGFDRLPDGRIIKVTDFKDKITPEQESSLRDLKGIGTNSDGSIRKGFVALESGKIVSQKQLAALMESK